MPSAQGQFPLKLFDTANYDPEPARERVRGAVTLTGSLTFLAVVSFYLYQAAQANAASWPNVKEAMGVILPAVTSVLGTARGFYFGSQKRS